MDSNTCAPEELEDKLLKTVVLYDDSLAAKRAMRVLLGTNQRLDLLNSQINLDFRFWTLDLLSESETLAEALAATETADILLVSVTNTSAPLATATKMFLSRCLTRPNATISALVGLLGPEEDWEAEDSELGFILRDLAQAASVEFFSPPASRAPSDVTFRKTNSPLIHRSHWSALND